METDYYLYRCISLVRYLQSKIELSNGTIKVFNIAEIRYNNNTFYVEKHNWIKIAEYANNSGRNQCWGNRLVVGNEDFLLYSSEVEILLDYLGKLHHKNCLDEIVDKMVG